MSYFLCPFFGAGGQVFDNSGVPLGGGKIYTYQAGTNSLIPTYTDSTGVTANTNPVILDSSGRVPGELWLTGGLQYKLVITNASGGSIGYTYDNISGVNDASYPQVTVSEWNLGSSPTYVSSTILTVPGNQTSTYQVNRRIQTTNTGGIATGTITASTYTAGSTLIVAAYDGIGLDSGLSILKYSLLSASPSSLPGTVLSAASLQAQTAIAFTSGGSTSAFTLTPTVPIAGYVANQEFDVTFNNTNTSGATMAISGLSALPLYRANSAGAYIAVTGGEVVNGWRSRVTVLAGAASLLIRDVVNPALSLVSMSAVTPVVYNSTSTIAIGDVNKPLYSTVSGISLTTPASPVAGQFVNYTNLSSGANTLTANTGSSLSILGLTSVPGAYVGAGDSVSMVFNGTTWVQTSGSAGFGIGQSWQNLTGSRAFGSPVTNYTGKTITVNILGSTASTNAQIAVTIGSTTLYGSNQYGSTYSAITFTVPPGSTYTVNLTGGSLNSWSEQR